MGETLYDISNIYVCNINICSDGEPSSKLSDLRSRYEYVYVK